TQLFLRSDLQPDAIEAWNGRAVRSLFGSPSNTDSPWLLMIRFGDVEAAVRWQVAKVQEIGPGSGGHILGILSAEESEAFWQQAAGAREIRAHGPEALIKCSVLYQSAAETADRLQALGQQVKAQTSVYCHAGTYVLHGRYEWNPGEEPPAQELRKGFLALREHCLSAGGHLVVEKVRPEVKNGLDVWGYDAPALKIMRSIKQEFDPKGLLNPGRFVGGI
ncbi:MAG: FAD-binding oxidoreductase, partial [Gammaproteobacteria bacterium]